MWYDVDYIVAHVMLQCELGKYSTTQRNMEKAERCPTNGRWVGWYVSDTQYLEQPSSALYWTLSHTDGALCCADSW